MITAEDLPHRRGAIIRTRSDANQSPIVLKSGRKVGNLNRGAGIIGQRRDQYRRVSQVFLLRGLEVCKLDVE